MSFLLWSSCKSNSAAVAKDGKGVEKEMIEKMEGIRVERQGERGWLQWREEQHNNIEEKC